jgi:hypothetical protein
MCRINLSWVQFEPFLPQAILNISEDNTRYMYLLHLKNTILNNLTTLIQLTMRQCKCKELFTNGCFNDGILTNHFLNNGKNIEGKVIEGHQKAIKLTHLQVLDWSHDSKRIDQSNISVFVFVYLFAKNMIKCRILYSVEIWEWISLK